MEKKGKNETKIKCRLGDLQQINDHECTDHSHNFAMATFPSVLLIVLNCEYKKVDPVWLFFSRVKFVTCNIYTFDSFA